MRIQLTIEVDTSDGGIQPYDAHDVVRDALRFLGDQLADQLAPEGFTKITGRFGPRVAHIRLDVTK